MDMSKASKNQQIVLRKKHQQSSLQKFLGCKCLAGPQEQIISNQETRKKVIKQLRTEYIVQFDDQVLLDGIKFMILVFFGNDDKVSAKYIEQCSITPTTGVTNYRADLQFYLPQLCNYLVFHRNLKDNYLKQALQKMSKLDFYFAHLYYFYMKSLEKNIAKGWNQILRPVVEYNVWLRNDLNSHYKNIQLTSLGLFIQQVTKKQNHEINEFTKNVIIDYESQQPQNEKLLKSTKVQILDIKPQKYISIFDNESQSVLSFQSNLFLFQDLFFICNQISEIQNKEQKASELIRSINKRLPSNVYIPFSKNFYRLCNILKIVTGQTKIFQKKGRLSSVRICVQTYCPADSLTESEEEMFWINVQTPISLKMTKPADRASGYGRNYQNTAEFKKFRQSISLMKRWTDKNDVIEEKTQSLNSSEYNDSVHSYKNVLSQKPQRQKRASTFCIQMVQMKLDDRLLQTQHETKLQKQISKYSQSQTSKSQKLKEVIGSKKSQKLKKVRGYNSDTRKLYVKQFESMFGQSLQSARQKISQTSIFSNIKSWNILYFIIKTKKDFKQQQFAMQLLQQFDYIFKAQSISLILTTYEVVSMGPDKGIIEMIKDSVTFNKLHKTLQTSFPGKLDLKSFFEIYYSDKLEEAKYNFVKSLAAYCLLMYIIQGKNRHNDNILLHKSGKVFHIDFSFIFSNTPEKTIQFQKDCPFKFVSQYVQVMEGVDSTYFKKFTQLFYQGFKAIRKNQEKILVLIKMMYSASGIAMSCFNKGDAAIIELERRINPPAVTNDVQLKQHCQQLINLSLESQAFKWYDRYQYWTQGIFF